MRLPAGTGATAAAFYRGDLLPIFKGNLFVAAEAGRELMRMRFDATDPSKVVSVERLLKDQIGPVRVRVGRQRRRTATSLQTRHCTGSLRNHDGAMSAMEDSSVRSVRL